MSSSLRPLPCRARHQYKKNQRETQLVTVNPERCHIQPVGKAPDESDGEQPAVVAVYLPWRIDLLKLQINRTRSFVWVRGSPPLLGVPRKEAEAGRDVHLGRR